MTPDLKLLEKLDGLYDVGRDMVERAQVHGLTVEYEFDLCRFDKWRKAVNDVLYERGGCDDIYYQRFRKNSSQPVVRDLEEGLRILSAVRDDVEGEMIASGALRKKRGRPSASYSISNY
ncbi:MAG: hypothetical protein HY912_12425 [Desulfomonile tiedjei]|uniref:Uncharacterized protein n=1 Tax=Desulfomonile tiedjei TaxID=2358 RepID=A0A9D6V2M4_9BACT|nr:hypothetical protein [Desulfomonile tiedjei]